MLKAVVFDFDGLIVDTEWATWQAWREVYAAHGQDFPLALWQLNVGSGHVFDPIAHLEKLTGERVDGTAVEGARQERAQAIVRGLSPMPGVLDRIAEAQTLGLKLGVASSSPARWLNYHLPRLGLLMAFEAVRGSSDVGGKKKPDPAVYLSACAGLGVAPDTAVAFEDSMHGVQAAKAAGLYCIAVPNEVTRTMDFSAADEVVGSLEAVSLANLHINL